uniref:Uncharacterized protein n=1 Tax=Parascaris univalens TaxID=6257 RepID=A0A915AG56_PARUN
MPRINKWDEDLGGDRGNPTARGNIPTAITFHRSIEFNRKTA